MVSNVYNRQCKRYTITQHERGRQMMQIKVSNGMAKVITPYNAEFVAKVKGIGGR